MTSSDIYIIVYLKRGKKRMIHIISDSSTMYSIESAKKNYIESNTLDLVDPIGAEKIISELNDEIDSFTSKVDAALSISNAITTIEISY